jgi:hypothetical protein
MAFMIPNEGDHCKVDFEYLSIYDDDVIEVRIIRDFPASKEYDILYVYNKDTKLHHTYYWKDAAYFVVRYSKKDIKSIEIIRSDETNLFNWDKEEIK